MAILGNIRKRTGLTIAVIGFAMVAFLVVDAFSKNSFLFGAADPSNFATINGQKVSYNEYQNAQRNLSLSGRNFPQNQVNSQAWNQIVTQAILKDHVEDLGLQMGPFQAEAMQFGMGTPEEAEAQMAEIKAAAEAGNPQAQNQYNIWLNSREDLKTSALNQQYMVMLSAGTQPTSLDAKEMAKETSSSVTFEYAYASYQDLETKNKIEVSDDEIKTFIKKYPKKYNREALVDLHYVTFPAEPSATDDSTALNYVRKFTKSSVQDGDSIQAFGSGNDSILIAQYSDAPYKPELQPYQSFASNKTLQDFVKTASIGAVTKPYKNGNAYYLSKLVGKETVDSANTRHILIKFAADSIAAADESIKTKAEAKVLADSLTTVLKAEPNKFVTLVQQFSEDPGSAQRGGVIGWMTKDSGLVQPYKDFGMNNAKGAIGIAESQFGFHIIEITDKKSGVGYKVANLTKNVEISDNTQKSLHDNANQFFADTQGKSANDFANIANEKSYAYQNSENVERFTPQAGYLPADQSEQILSWAFSSKTDAGATKLFPMSNGGQIVVYLQSRYEAGLANPASVRKEVEPILKRQKMYDLMNGKSADISMDKFVSEYGATKANATSTFAAATIQDKGLEPAVVGAAFGLKQNESSKLIKGNGGLYIVKTLSKTEGSAPENVSSQVKQLEGQYNQSLNSRLIPSLIENADIKDNRAKFFTSDN